jgi:hypothetical protein
MKRKPSTITVGNMSETLSLQEKRNELKWQLTSGKYQTLVGRMCGGASRLVQRITRTSKPLPIWYGAVVIGLSLVLIFGLLSLLTGEADLYRDSYNGISGARLFAGSCLFIWLSLGYLLALNRRYQSISAQVAEQLLDMLESESDLADIQQWLLGWTRIRRPLLVAIVYMMVVGPYSVVFLSSYLGVFIGIGGIYLHIVIGIFLGIGFYYFYLFGLLPLRIRKYRFKLFAADPSHSKAITCLLDIFNANAYLAALLLASGMLLGFLSGVLPVYGIVVVLLGWVPLIVIFILHHSALAEIITTAKWAMLYEIQAKIEQLQVQAGILTEETLGQIEKLLNYHDRIATTRNSALNLRTGLSFVNSLLLPLLAFVLGNLDKIFALLNSIR